MYVPEDSVSEGSSRWTLRPTGRRRGCGGCRGLESLIEGREQVSGLGKGVDGVEVEDDDVERPNQSQSVKE